MVEVVEVVEDVEIGRYVGYGEVEEGMSEFSEQSVSKSVTNVNIELLGQLKMGSLPVDLYCHMLELIKDDLNLNPTHKYVYSIAQVRQVYLIIIWKNAKIYI